MASKLIETCPLPDAEQEAIARELQERIAADARWDALLSDPRSDALLKRLADEVRADIAGGDIIDADPATGVPSRPTGRRGHADDRPEMC